MTRVFTPEEVALCDQFEEFLKGLVTGPVRNISVTRHRDFNSSSVQDEHQAFFGTDSTSRASMATYLQNALNELWGRNPSPEERRAQRLADLRAELARLEQAA